jgi:hypothetical protein
MKTFNKLLIVAISMLLVGPELAVGGTVTVGGDYEANVITGPVTSFAVGKNAHAAVNAGGMQLQGTSVEIQGKFKTNVITGALTAGAVGKEVSSHINVGGIQSMNR